MEHIAINSKKELFRWGPIEFRLLYGAFFIQTIWLDVPQRSPWSWARFLVLFENGRAAFIGEDKILRDAGEKYFKRYFLNSRNFKAHWRKYQKWIIKFNAFKKRADFDNPDWFKDFINLNREFWLIVQVPEVANWGGERLLKRVLERIDKARALEYLEILSAPEQLSFFQKEELDLLRTRGSVRALEEHARKYSWLLNSYGGNRALPLSYFQKKLRALLSIAPAVEHIIKIQNQARQVRARKIALGRRIKINGKIMLVAKQLSKSIWWQDHRKSYIWQMHALLDIFLKKLATQTGWKFDDLLWCWPAEILILSQGVNSPPRGGAPPLGGEFSKIAKRKHLYAIYLDNVKVREYYGVGARRLIQKYLTQGAVRANFVRGLTVSRGSGAARGRVKIILNPFKDLSKMHKGDVLVASMTSPEFIVVMKKAAAIVTDAGGMTSHAAIVSRELGIPCVVGTRVATKIFRDGDLVEVNANHGVVTVIKRA